MVFKFLKYKPKEVKKTKKQLEEEESIPIIIKQLIFRIKEGRRKAIETSCNRRKETRRTPSQT